MTEKLEWVAIDDIIPNPYQPRIYFDEKELLELSASIKANGLIQPLIVRKSKIFGYELIAGERRLKAAKLAHLSKVPVIVKTISDNESMQQAVIENLQRSDLNPIEEAKAYQQLIEKDGMTHDELARLMGKSRPYITNTIRLLNLPEQIIEAVEKKELSQGHARVLLTVENAELQNEWFEKIIKQGLSVRQIEKALKSTKKQKKVEKDLFIKNKEEELSQLLGTKVSLSMQKKEAGVLKIYFQSEEEFNRIIDSLS
ncbi:ParB/RepB/Spo0J family partition protein [Streptococcus pantholopis]|uniref:Chromosome partitioning protein ParB n=1 Tax=Streptococcus pantholopis TaxID=1811193 RepID=A0A172Q9Y3_9STRE|nr:ParB/RepB/Spo0J family partition protein [Streptococcus pantholopis]AND80237.1 chromosome partitioning protein ParB [Streptococcus pantholopis]